MTNKEDVEHIGTVASELTSDRSRRRRLGADLFERLERLASRARRACTSRATDGDRAALTSALRDVLPMLHAAFDPDRDVCATGLLATLALRAVLVLDDADATPADDAGRRRKVVVMAVGLARVRDAVNRMSAVVPRTPDVMDRMVMTVTLHAVNGVYMEVAARMIAASVAAAPTNPRVVRSLVECLAPVTRDWLDACDGGLGRGVLFGLEHGGTGTQVRAAWKALADAVDDKGPEWKAEMRAAIDGSTTIGVTSTVLMQRLQLLAA